MFSYTLMVTANGPKRESFFVDILTVIYKSYGSSVHIKYMLKKHILFFKS